MISFLLIQSVKFLIMNINDAKKMALSYKNMIGTVDEKGFSIDKILIVPHNEKLRKKFFDKYVLNMDMEEAIAPYQDEDMDVWAVDFKHFEDSRTLFFNKLSK